MKFLNPFARTLSGSLMCPACESRDIRKVEQTGLAETRYKCRKCGQYFRYQYRNRPQSEDRTPYMNFKRGLKLDVLNRFKNL